MLPGWTRAARRGSVETRRTAGQLHTRKTPLKQKRQRGGGEKDVLYRRPCRPSSYSDGTVIDRHFLAIFGRRLSGPIPPGIPVGSYWSLL